MEIEIETLNGSYKLIGNDDVNIGLIKRRIQKYDYELQFDKEAYITYKGQKLNDHEVLGNIKKLQLVMKNFPSYYSIIKHHFGIKSIFLDIFTIIISVLFLASCSQIGFYLPMTWSNYIFIKDQVPVTFQTFAVFLLGPFLGLKMSVSVTLLYWILIAAGAPFGANQKGGLITAYGSTGGYFLGFVIGSSITSLLSSRGYDRNWRSAIFLMVITNIIIYICGITWMPFGISVVKNISVNKVSCGFGYGCFGNIFMWGFIPFIPGDIIKILLAWIILPLGWKYLTRLSTKEKIIISENNNLDVI